MGTQRFVAGNLIVASLAALSIIGFVPWLIAAFLIIAVAIIASVPSTASSTNPPSVEKVSLETSSIRTEKNPTAHARLEPARNIPQTRQSIESLSKGSSFDEKPMDVGQKTIPGDDYLSFEVGLREGEELVADVSAEGPL